ncbi:hypothetical protein V6N12_067838 [Hibiscus sabdariffa]|uniref:Uncharacterized protein n=1 Tax=Hibiscus sabdariffa TaxID=183260 RepID=A0ABR2FNI9_9ROSI
MRPMSKKKVLKATTSAIEAVPVSFIHAPSQDNAPFFPIHHVPNQDNAPFVPVHPVPGQDNAPSVPIDLFPIQDYAQRSRKRQSRLALPAESLVNWVVSEKQDPNGRFDKALPWKDKATDQEVKEFINESLKKMHKADASTSAIPKGITH